MYYSHSKILLLSTCVFIHVIFQLSSLFFMFNQSYYYINILVIAVVISFLWFKRCIIIDIYDYINSLGNIKNHIDYIPDFAKDNFLRTKVKHFLNLKSKKDMTIYRLDILENELPRCDFDMLSHKIHYISMNIILINILLFHYKLQFLIPLLIIWILQIFKL